MTLADVSRAHFYADSVRDVFIKLPPEDPRAGEEGICGKLLKTMYGTLDAAERWSEDYSSHLGKHGFVRGKASPCHFFHPQWNVHMLVHGDDFVFVGRRSGRQKPSRP